MIKIYIITDLEGISGLDTLQMMEERYQECRDLLMQETNAAIQGALEGGADQVHVLDGHGTGINFIDHKLHPQAIKSTTPGKPWWSALDHTFSALYAIGTHAMAGTQNAFLDHTQSSQSWYEYTINGRPSGELAQWAAIAGHWNIPILMVSGDRAACTEARTFFGSIETAETKTAHQRNTAQLVPIAESHTRIKEAAKHAIALIGKIEPYKPTFPAEITLHYTRTDYCDTAAQNPKNHRLDARTIRIQAPTALDIFP